MDRRECLGALATGAVVTLAGCADVVQSIADSSLEDVNVTSDVEDPITVPVTIEAPDGTTVFDRSPSFDDGGMEQYGDVWETTGDYTVHADVADESGGETAAERRGQPSVTKPVTIPHRDASLIVEYSPDGFEIGTFEERS